MQSVSKQEEDPGVAHKHHGALPEPHHLEANPSVLLVEGGHRRLQEEAQGDVERFVAVVSVGKGGVVFLGGEVSKQALLGRADEGKRRHEQAQMPQHFGHPYGLLGRGPREDTDDGASAERGLGSTACSVGTRRSQ